ncbi:MAG: 2-oxoacid ferredoxin oxidoreductase [Deltaproteobacteria bacterium RBG_13_52_11b]|nr:MAG: 2-oxoacid ferredoxin oxidoreductase [Deltaproteobacteria bacterium RBG_13_52_11b]
MVDIKDYGEYKTAWCPGCGNFPLLKAVKKALVKRGLEPHQVLFVAGIGQAAKAPHYLNANLFNGLHGRSVPVATGAKLANPNLVVIAESGDGCVYGEGGNHFLSAIRRNIDITLLVHNNQVYGLTKGQASPTSDQGFITKAQPEGVLQSPFNPLAIAIAMHAGFVARGYVGLEDPLVDVLVQAIGHRGFSLVDILQPCVSFNRVNTYPWYQDRCKPLPSSYDPTDWEAAIRLSQQWGDEIPVGVIYRNERPPFEDHFSALRKGPLVGQELDHGQLAKIIETYM